MEELKDQLNDLLEIAKHAASEAGQFLVSCPPESRLVEKYMLRDRKILAEIAYDSPEAFKTIIKKGQSALN